MTDLIGFLLITSLVVMGPGVDFALITKRTIKTGKIDGVKTALGLTSGALIHTSAAAFGLSILIMQSAAAFEIIRYLGALYLIYIGVSSFIKRKKVDKEENINIKTNSSAYRQGLLSNTLNPKVAIFFLTFLPQFVIDGMNVSLQFLIMGAIYSLLSIIWFLSIVYLLNFIRKFLMSNFIQNVIDKITGLVLIGFGLNLVFNDPKK